MPGGGAEVFSPRVRKIIADRKVPAETWLEVHREAHGQGMRTNATLLFGHFETPEEKVDHMVQLRELQDDTSGFQAFIPLPFLPGNTDFAYLPGPSARRSCAPSPSRASSSTTSRTSRGTGSCIGEDITSEALSYGLDDLVGHAHRGAHRARDDGPDAARALAGADAEPDPQRRQGARRARHALRARHPRRGRRLPARGPFSRPHLIAMRRPLLAGDSPGTDPSRASRGR